MHGAATRPASPRLRGLGAIAHPVALGALVVLVVHDVALRPLLPPLVAGKLSDVAGLVVFPLVVAALIAIVVDDERLPIQVGTTVTVVWFGAMKLFGQVAGATARLAEVVAPAARVTVDPTDLVALPAVAVAAWVWRHRVPRRAWGAPVLVLAVLWSAATSCAVPDEGSGVGVRSDGSFVVDLAGDTLAVDATGALEDSSGGDRPRRLDDGVRDRVCLDDGTCVLARGHDVVEVAPDGTERVAVDIPEDRFDYARRSGSSCGPSDPYRPVEDLAANADGVVVVAHGSHGVSVRDSAGTWQRLDLYGVTTFSGPVPVDETTLVIAAAVLGLLIATWLAGGWAILSAVAVLVGGAGVGAAALGGLAVLGAWLATGVALTVAFAQVAVVARQESGRAALAVLGTFAAAGVVAQLLLEAWAAAWIDSIGIALGAGLSGIAAATVIETRRRMRLGTWAARTTPADRAAANPTAADDEPDDGEAPPG